jgi:uncharacterized protein (DUF2236 family)
MPAALGRVTPVAAHVSVGQPLTADSLTWRLGFPRTLILFAGRALLMQVAHPVIGAGVRDFSSFETDPWGRLERTIDSLTTQLFGGPALIAEADRLKQLHTTIKGTGFSGERYSALQPEAYAWVHMSNFETAVHANHMLVRPLSLAQKRQLFDEWRQVGLVLGIKDDKMPPNFDEVAGYVRRTIDERLGSNETTGKVIGSLALAGVEAPRPFVPQWMWRSAKPVGRRLLHDFTVGTTDPELREKLGMRWTDTDQRRLERTARVVRTVARGVPAPVLHYPQAYPAVRASRALAR